MEKPNYFAIIPADVRYAKINTNAKLLYGEITALCNKEGFCWANNNYFSMLYDVDKRSVIMWLNILKDAGFIIITYKNNATRSGRNIIIDTKPVNKISPPREENFTPPREENFTHNNTSINSTSNITTNVVTEFGNSGVNEIIDYFKLRLELPALDGTVKGNRYAAKRLLVKSKDNVKAVKMLIDCLAADNFHAENASSLVYLDKHAVAIMQRARKNNKIGVVK